jgi:Rieske Fe-S protein
MEPSRRDFLAGCAAAAAAAGAGGCALLRTTVEPDIVLPAVDGEVRVPAMDLPWRDTRHPRASLAIEVKDRDGKIMLFRDPDGAPRAVDMTCSHFQCDVAWSPPGGKFVCPCHGSEYSPAGEVLKGPAKKPLRSYGVRVDGEDVVVALGS